MAPISSLLKRDDYDRDTGVGAASYYIAIVVVVVCIVILSLAIRFIHVKRRQKILRGLANDPARTVRMENNPYWVTQREHESKLPTYLESTLGGVGNRILAPARAHFQHPAEHDNIDPALLPPPYEPAEAETNHAPHNEPQAPASTHDPDNSGTNLIRRTETTFDDTDGGADMHLVSQEPVVANTDARAENRV